MVPAGCRAVSGFRRYRTGTAGVVGVRTLTFRFGIMNSKDDADDFHRLYGLVTESGDVKDYLDEMACLGSSTMTRLAGERVECAVTLRRRKRSATMGGSSEDAVLLDGVEQRLGKGPCALALRTGSLVLLDDVIRDERWPRYSESVAATGCRSVLGLPLAAGFDAGAVLVFFGSSAGLFTQEVIRDANDFAEIAGRALCLVLKIAAAEEAERNLRSALGTRTAIDLARGMLMVQNGCGQDEAFRILRRVSNMRNQKLHDLAEEIVSQVPGGQRITTHFED